MAIYRYAMFYLYNATGIYCVPLLFLSVQIMLIKRYNCIDIVVYVSGFMVYVTCSVSPDIEWYDKNICVQLFVFSLNLTLFVRYLPRVPSQVL